LKSGGAERQATRVAIILAQEGHDVSILTYSPENFYADMFRNTNVHFIELSGTSKIGAIIQTRRQLVSGRYDAVLAILRSPILCAEISSLLAKRWRLIIRMGSANKNMFMSKYGKAMLALAGIVDGIVCNSEREAAFWRSSGKIPQEKLVVIYNDVQLADIHSNYVMRKDGRAHIVVAASYYEVKNIDRVLEAILLLSEEERRQLCIEWYGRREINLGNTKFYDAAERKVHDNNMDTCVHLHDETKSIHERMNEADYVGLFSIFEGLPNAICEGMMLGKPIIMSRISDFQVLVDGNGYLCDSTNAASIAEALRNVITTSKGDMIRQGKRSQDIAMRLFDSETIKQKWLHVMSGE
jgi:glycosyltransferase involved in cell wall biosynthesis